MQKNILITGQPRSGKSTLLEKVISDIPNKVGFITKEILANGQRTGFKIRTHLGNELILADIHRSTPYKFSKYFVNVQALDTIIPEVATFNTNDILYLDEIAPLELFSEKFKRLVLQYLDSKNTCLATVKRGYADDFIQSIEKRDDVIFVEITAENREEKGLFVRQLLKKIEKARNYISEPERFTKRDGLIILKSEHDMRNLALRHGKWKCDCSFFQKNRICSHSIATKKFVKSF